MATSAFAAWVKLDSIVVVVTGRVPDLRSDHASFTRQESLRIKVIQCREMSE